MTRAKAPNVGEYAPAAGTPASANLQRVPPQSIEAEVCVLGSMILQASCIDLIVQVTRAGIGNKGPALTTFLSIPGRYLIIIAGAGFEFR